MTEQDLKQLYFLNREVERLMKDLNKMKSRDIYRSPTISGMPRGTKSKDIGDYIAELVDLEEIIGLNLRKIQLERAKLERYIGNIGDAEMRLIMRLRHINGMTFNEIAMEIGYSGPHAESTVRKKHKTYLKKVSENSD